jgi:hypothetical protein
VNRNPNIIDNEMESIDSVLPKALNEKVHHTLNVIEKGFQDYP